MTSRERFNLTLAGGSPDRPPLFEEGIRDDVLHRWRGEGLPADVLLQDLFGYDRREDAGIEVYPAGARGRPWPGIRSRHDLRTFANLLESTNPNRLPSGWESRARIWANRDSVLDLLVHVGLFQVLGVRDGATFAPAICLLADDPVLVREALERYAAFVGDLASRVLERTDVDMVTFSEPIGSTHGPLISPGMYRDLVLSTYRPLIQRLRALGVRWFVFRTYANARHLLLDVVDAGFNVLWAMEDESGAMDYRDIRREFGDSLRLIGGIDLDRILQSESAMRHELDECVRPLLAGGGYVPLADGRIRATVPYPAYRRYRDALARLVRQA